MIIDTIKRARYDIFALLLLLAISIAFFSRLFYPELSLYITPEYNGSDTTNFNMPVKFFLSESLKNGELPLWISNMGTGFPIFAETQIGLFFIPNLLLFGLLPFTVAFNLGYVVSIFTAAAGMFAYLRYKKASILASMFGGFVFGFSGFFIGHLNHYNMIQVASILPWLLLVFTLFRDSRKLYWIVVFSLLLSQQFFAGYGQITFITLVVIATDMAVHYAFPLKSVKERLIPFVKDTGFLFLGFIGAIFLSAVMLLPTRELMASVTRPENYDVLHATAFSFPFKQFAGFLSPFILGSPRFGTFPDPEVYYGNFFWETVPYIGLIPFFGVVYYIIKNIKKRRVLVYGTFILIFTVLMLGKFSPGYFIYSIPPFNIFRVPSRFILAVIAGLSILFAYSLDDLWAFAKKKYSNKIAFYIIVGLFAITIGDIFYNWYTYHPITKSTNWLDNPQFAQTIKEDGVKGRIMTLQGGLDKADIYKDGWENSKDFFIDARNEMLPNMNLVWDLPQLQAYSGLSHYRRHNLFEGVLEFSTSSRNKTNPEYLLDIAYVGYTIFPQIENIPYEGLEKMDQIDIEGFGKSYYLLKNTDVLARARVYRKYTKVETLNGLVEEFIEADEELLTTAVVEDTLPFVSQDDDDAADDTDESDDVITITSDENQRVVISANMKSEGLLVLADMYHEDWKAQIDGNPAEVLPVNLIQRGVVVPEGSHEVVFTYEPEAFYKGAKVSIAAHVIALLILAHFFVQRLRAPRASKR